MFFTIFMHRAKNPPKRKKAIEDGPSKGKKRKGGTEDSPAKNTRSKQLKIAKKYKKQEKTYCGLLMSFGL